MNTIINTLLLILFIILPGYNTPKYKAIGMASYYSKNLDGKKTASGEFFDSNKFTGAHRTLPFNTLVNVINLSNGLSVKVKINDRGPYSKRRIIDLSYCAAKLIGLIDKGTERVKIEETQIGASEETIVAQGAFKGEDIFKNQPNKIYDLRGNEVTLNNYTCRIFKTNSEVKCKKFIEQIKEKKIHECYLRILNGIYLKKFEITTGNFVTEEKANLLKEQLQKQGYNCTVLHLN